MKVFDLGVNVLFCFFDPATLRLGSPTALFKSNGGIRLREGVHRLIVVVVTKLD